ncbi:MAG: hypothetical protein HYX91_04860 [Chloroflexi bacterium]|nr:hypothetical protein [Chloroflexota bacterium]
MTENEMPAGAPEATGEDQVAQEEVARQQLVPPDVARLEQMLAEREADVSTLKQAIADREGRTANLERDLASTVAAYRALVIQTNPGLPGEMVGGDSVEEINRSLAGARALVQRVKEELEAETSRARVPAGAPPRTPPDLSALSPMQKIKYAIGGNR